MIAKRVSIVADGGGGAATLSWSPAEPYQSAIESRGMLGSRVRGLTIPHRSPSVANNYAVFLQGELDSAVLHSTTQMVDFPGIFACAAWLSGTARGLSPSTTPHFCR